MSEPTQIRFIKPYGLNAVGDVITPQPRDIGRILVCRGVAAWVKDNDLDRDGKDEGGLSGIKKAFSAPPIGKRSGKK